MIRLSAIHPDSLGQWPLSVTKITILFVSVNFFTITDFDYFHNQLPIFYLVNDPVLPYPNAITILKIFQLFNPGWPRI